MNAAEISQALGGRHCGRGYRARCVGPGHDDRHPSLDIEDRDGKVLLIDRSGRCTQDEIIDALRARGLWESTRGERSHPVPAIDWLQHLTPKPPEVPPCCLLQVPRCGHWIAFDREMRLAHLHWELLEASTEVADLYERAGEPLTTPALKAELILSVEVGGIATLGFDNAVLTAAIGAVADEVVRVGDEPD
jgi:hypothetical protein